LITIWIQWKKNRNIFHVRHCLSFVSSLVSQSIRCSYLMFANLVMDIPIILSPNIKWKNH
jgi:hypothetical protein